jgi:hypothetical protein
MTAPLFIRRYRPEDRAACLRLFEGNIPAFFTGEERVMFEGFLGKLPGPYLVAEDPSGQLVVCGGMSFRSDGDVTLCWGLVDAPRHKEGIGTVMVRVLLALACRLPGVACVFTKTSDENVSFFEREGLRPVSVIEGYFRPSKLLRCELDAARRAELESQIAALSAQGHRMEEGLLPAGGQAGSPMDP